MAISIGFLPKSENMKKKELREFRDDVEKALNARIALGDFDANSKYMRYLLGSMLRLVDNAIDTYPKSAKKNASSSS